MIVATAGHVDHGKTELVRALTGIDTDRLPEEKARGLSIDLGFAYRSAPGQKPLGFVDVPGHEKFVRNMLAGVGGIDLGLLVVAADDGVMPQTREHFAILDLLGIEQCLVAITKIDRVDDQRIRQVEDQVITLLDSAGHTDVAVFPVCAPQSDGIDALQQVLQTRGQALPERATDGHFRMAIDRVFTLRGIGLVVTGMVVAGSTTIDDELVVSGDGSRVRVRGIRAHDEASDRARAGERCAINITGRGVNEKSVARGNWLLQPQLFVPTRRIDVDLRVLDSEPRSLKHWTPTQLHIGADRLPARIAVISGGSIAAGEHGLAQLVLDRDAFVTTGDRFVLRDQSARRTMAGGEVIDPFAPKRGRSRPARIAALQAMNQRDVGPALRTLTDLADTGVELARFAVARNLAPQKIDALVASLELQRVGSGAAQRLFSNRRWQNLLTGIEQSVAAFHLDRPAMPGASLEDIQQRLAFHVERAVLESAVAELARANRLGQRSARFHAPTHEIMVADEDQKLIDRATTLLSPDEGSPPSLHQAAEILSVDPKKLESALKQGTRTGELVAIARNRFLPTAYVAQLGHAAEQLAAESGDGQFGVADYCAQVGTGRNFAIDLLEYFDRLGFTQRSGNSRRIRRSASSVFAATVKN